MDEKLNFEKVIIHLGLHKTASSFLQDEVFPNTEDYYFLDRRFTQYNSSFNKLLFADESLYDEDSLIKELQKIKTQKLLISDENLSGKPVGFNYINRTIIAKRLKSIFPTAEVVLLLRGQKEMLRATYNMWVKSDQYAGDKCISSFIWKGDSSYDLTSYENNNEGGMNLLHYNTNEFLLSLDNYDYYSMIKTYKELFDDSCHIIPFESLKEDPKAFLERLELIFESKITIDLKALTKKNNPSLNFNELSNKTLINKVNKIGLGKLASKLMYFYLKFIKKQSLNESVYRKELEDSLPFYFQSNKKVIKDFPEIGLQNYPENYRIS